MAEKGESAGRGASVVHGLAAASDAGLEARTHYNAQGHHAASLRLATEAVWRLQTDALHRKRALAIGIVRHWAELVGISLLGSAWLSLVCFWTIRASVTMCDYVVSDKPRYNADVSIMEAVTELLQCRLTMKNFAWNQHWSMFLSYGLLRELYELMLPVIFAVNLFGDRLAWPRWRKRCFTVGVPAVVTVFLFFWHAGLGQPGLLRATILGQVVFYGASTVCFVEISRLLHRMDPESRLSVHWVLFIFGFSVVFPTFIYRTIVAPISYGRGVSGYNKLIMRLIVHPAICETALCILRNFARQLNGTRPGMTSMLFVVLLVIRAVFGRFLMMQVQDIGSVVLLQACISFIGCITRISAKDTDSIFVKVLYGSRPADAVMSTRKHNDLLVFEMQMSMLTEYAALISVPVFVIAGRITLGGIQPDINRLVSNTVAQVFVQSLIDLISLLYDVFYHNIDHLHVWATRRDRSYLMYLALHFTVHGFFVFYNSIFAMFCPLWEGETELSGLRMDYCLIMPSYESQATLPQYFLIKKLPNHAPGAAPPLFSVNDWVTYESHMNPAVCRGTSLMENCMIDRFFVPVEA